MESELIHANSRGQADHGWLQSQHTFSFAGYHNPERMGFGLLRVVNDDVVQASRGFDTHPHQDMEIVSIPLKGSLRHEDSMGCLLYTSPSPRDQRGSRMPSSA